MSESVKGRRIETVYNTRTLLIDVCCLETADNNSGGGDGRNYSEVVYQYVPRHEAADAAATPAADADRMHDMASLTDPSSSWTIPPVKQTGRDASRQGGRLAADSQLVLYIRFDVPFQNCYTQHCKKLDVRTALFWRFSPCK